MRIYDGGLCLWPPTIRFSDGVSDCMRLERAQNRAGRLISGTPLRTSSDRLRRELGWTSLIGRRKMYLHASVLAHAPVRYQNFDVYKSTLPSTRQHNSQRMIRNASAKTLPIPSTYGHPSTIGLTSLLLHGFGTLCQNKCGVLAPHSTLPPSSSGMTAG